MYMHVIGEQGPDVAIKVEKIYIIITVIELVSFVKLVFTFMHNCSSEVEKLKKISR